MKRVRQILAVLGIATVMFVAAPPVAAQAAAWDCPSSSLCVWDGKNGTGKRCSWTGRDNDWHNSPTVCSWAKNWPVRSARNTTTVPVYIFNTPATNVTADPILSLSGRSSSPDMSFYGSWHYFG